MVACIEIGMEWWGLLLHFYDKDCRIFSAAGCLPLLKLPYVQMPVRFSQNALKMFLEKQTGISVNFL